MIEILNEIYVAVPIVLGIISAIIGKVALWWKQMRNGGSTHKKVTATLELVEDLRAEVEKLKKMQKKGK